MKVRLAAMHPNSRPAPIRKALEGAGVQMLEENRLGVGVKFTAKRSNVKRELDP